MEQCDYGGGEREQGIRHSNIYHKDGKRIIKKEDQLAFAVAQEKDKAKAEKTSHLNKFGGI